jgi:hypothetical protein
MVKFYAGTELSKRLNISSKEKSRLFKYILELIELIYLLLGKDQIDYSSFPPLFRMGLKLKISGAERTEIEKALRYHILSSDYRGYKFIENLFTIEAFISYIENEHPKLLYHKLISYLGEEFVYSNVLLSENDKLFYTKSLDHEIILKKNSNSLPHQFEELKMILSLSSLQMEYLFFDLNPSFIASGMDLLPYEIQKKIATFLPFEIQQMTLIILSKMEKQQSEIEFFKFLLGRLRSTEKNSFELRRLFILYNRLYRGEEFSYRLNTSSKLKVNIKEILLILLGVSGKIREIGFLGSKEIISLLNVEDFTFLKMGLQYLLDGWHPTTIRFILENYILSGDFRGSEFLKRFIILDGCYSLSIKLPEYVLLEKCIQTIGSEHRQEIETFLNEAVELRDLP